MRYSIQINFYRRQERGDGASASMYSSTRRWGSWYGQDEWLRVQVVLYLQLVVKQYSILFLTSLQRRQSRRGLVRWQCAFLPLPKRWFRLPSRRRTQRSDLSSLINLLKMLSLPSALKWRLSVVSARVISLNNFVKSPTFTTSSLLILELSVKTLLICFSRP